MGGSHEPPIWKRLVCILAVEAQRTSGDPGIVGLRMPRNGPPYLTDDQINQVKQWIQNGAKND